MRICLALELGAFGAAESYAISLAKGFAGRGHDVLLVYAPEIMRPVLDKIDASQVRSFKLPVNRIARYRAARRILRDFAPHVVHVNTVLSIVMLAARRSRIDGRVMTEHVLPLQPHYNWRGSLMSRLARQSTRLLIVFSRANAIVAQSIWRDVAIRVIPPSVNVDDKPRTPPTELRTSRGISVVAISRLSPEKRIDVLLRATARLASSGQIREVVIVGEGPERSRLVALSAELNISKFVRWTGYLSDVTSALDQADVFIHCSEREGFGVAILEAMARGIPAIVTDLPSIREVVGDSALSVVPVNDEIALARAIASAALDSDLRREKSKAARNRASALFSRKAMIERHERLYEKLIDS